MIKNLYSHKSLLYKSVACMLTLLFLQSCNQSEKRPAGNKDTVRVLTAVPKTEPLKNPIADTLTAGDCPLGPAEPVLKKDLYPRATFALQSDKRTGIETLLLENGDKLIIKQSGCEYYVLHFRFETSRFEADTSDMAYWSNTALTMLRQINKGLRTPLDIAEAFKQLSARLEQGKSGAKLNIGDEIDFGGPDPRQYMIIERISKTADNRYLLELSLNYGPI
jgi:hypothetical protein